MGCAAEIAYISCSDVLNLIGRYHSYDLDPFTANQVRTHIQSCSSCRKIYKKYAMTLNAYQSYAESCEASEASSMTDTQHNRLRSNLSSVLGVKIRNKK